MNKEFISQPVQLEGVPNCRDLGGIVNTEGKKIKKGMLFRSSDLHNATNADVFKLNSLGVDNDVDLRMEEEILSKPDRMANRWDLYHFPVFKAVELADTEGNVFSTIEQFLKNAEVFMTDMYPEMLLPEQAVKTWKNFFKLLLKENSGGIIYHCTEGKDRTGIASILIEAALDVDEEKIFEDYMETNELVGSLIEENHKKLEKLPFDSEHLQQDFVWYLKTEPCYFDAAKKAVEPFGGWKGYLKEKIGLTDDDFKTLQNKYLEEA